MAQIMNSFEEEKNRHQLSPKKRIKNNITIESKLI